MVMFFTPLGRGLKKVDAVYALNVSRLEGLSKSADDVNKVAIDQERGVIMEAIRSGTARVTRTPVAVEVDSRTTTSGIKPPLAPLPIRGKRSFAGEVIISSGSDEEEEDAGASEIIPEGNADGFIKA